jgi:large subunit ribosomal protein L9
MAKLILTHEVTGLGSAGDVVDVKNGYARNYLVPQGLAILWSRGGEKQVTDIKQARTVRALASLDEAQALKAKLESVTITVKASAGSEGRLFGSVKTADIAAAVAEAGLGDIDKRTIEIATAIKSTGAYSATVRLHDGVSATLALTVVARK